VSDTYVVTGGTDGIGRATALHLARAGGRVLFTGRSKARAAEALAELKAASPLDHRFVEADFARMADVARAAEKISAEDALRAIVHCAGIISDRPEPTADGLEANFAVNYLSRYLLTRKLLASLERHPDPRVVIVAAAGYFAGTHVDLDAICRREFKSLKPFEVSQFSNDPLGLELAARAPKVATTVIRPGMVRTNLRAKASSLPRFFRVLGPLNRFWPSAEQFARTPAALASDPATRSLGGTFVGSKPNKKVAIPAASNDPVLRRRLWEVSEALVAPLL
jgi:NAD(P)-dependent dehydrogenase (short-subunit alcohol dehydrogenase family)